MPYQEGLTTPFQGATEVAVGHAAARMDLVYMLVGCDHAGRTRRAFSRGPFSEPVLDGTTLSEKLYIRWTYDRKSIQIIL